MKISELQAKQGKVDLVVEVVEKDTPREFEKFGKKGRVCNVKVKDDSGDIKLTLWNDDIDRIAAGDKLHIKNGYVNEWQGEKQLTTGKFGMIEKIGEDEAEEMDELSKDEADIEKELEDIEKDEKDLEEIESEDGDLDELDKEEKEFDSEDDIEKELEDLEKDREELEELENKSQEDDSSELDRLVDEKSDDAVDIDELEDLSDSEDLEQLDKEIEDEVNDEIDKKLEKDLKDEEALLDEPIEEEVIDIEDEEKK